MARIKTYGLDSDISAADKVVGTDGTQGDDFGKTKNFSVGALRSFIGTGGNLVTKKITVTTEQLKVINTVPITVVDVAENEAADVVSIIAKMSNQSTENNLNYLENLSYFQLIGYSF